MDTDEQVMRAITTAMACVWLAPIEGSSLRDVCTVAAKLQTYIETGEKPA